MVVAVCSLLIAEGNILLPFTFSDYIIFSFLNALFYVFHNKTVLLFCEIWPNGPLLHPSSPVRKIIPARKRLPNALKAIFLPYLDGQMRQWRKITLKKAALRWLFAPGSPECRRLPKIRGQQICIA